MNDSIKHYGVKGMRWRNKKNILESKNKSHKTKTKISSLVTKQRIDSGRKVYESYIQRMRSLDNNTYRPHSREKNKTNVEVTVQRKGKV